MKKQFELSTYGVEEMTQKELLEINGGAIICGIIAITGLLVGIASLVYMIIKDGQETTKAGSANDFNRDTLEYGPGDILTIIMEPGYQYYIHGDTVRVEIK